MNCTEGICSTDWKPAKPMNSAIYEELMGNGTPCDLWEGPEFTDEEIEAYWLEMERQD